MAERTQDCDYAAVSTVLLEESVPALLFSEQFPQYLSTSQDLFSKSPNPFAKPTKDKNNHVYIIKEIDPLSEASSINQCCDSDTEPLIHTSQTYQILPAVTPECAWSRSHNLGFGFRGREASAQRQQHHVKYLRNEKCRDSAERAKAVDAVHKHQISIHREKEKRRNSEARRKAKEQKIEVQMKERKLKVATKSLKNAQEKERKEWARAVGITRTRSMFMWIEHKVASLLPKSFGIESYDLSGKRDT